MPRPFSLASALALAIVVFAGSVASAAPLSDDPPPLRVSVEDGRIAWTPLVTVGHLTLEISGPEGIVVMRAFAGAETPSLDLASLGLPDGEYAYQAVLSELDHEHEVIVQEGRFAWVEGAASVQDAAMVIVHAQDVTIQGSLCVGVDCASAESFGFDTQRYKENNLRIHFDDTSSSAAFPRNDWRIQINDSANGGASYFGIDDATAGTRPFRIDAGAGANALVIGSSGGNVGLGTATPVLELHVADGDTPSIRLEQNGTAGWSPQAWDMAGNESNFFVRDVTNGSALPFRIRPGAPTNTLYIASGGDIGLGTAAPTERLTVAGNGAFSGTLAASSVSASGDLSAGGDILGSGRLELSADYAGSAPFQVVDTNAAGDPGDDETLLTLDDAGNLTALGTVNGSSSVHLKTDFLPVDNAQILSAVREIPLTTWRYRADAESVRHLGPMSQDFRAAFGLGVNDTSISMADADGVAMASIQALAAENDELRERIAELERLVSELAARDQ
ncbi:tail fiber domain-containing protein [Rubricoccus marinus]|nr:tail fiber domain-containing protein [Rubricoccus marinus]